MALCLAMAPVVVGQDAKSTDVDPASSKTTVDRAIDYLMANQDADGAFSKQLGPAVTAMCATAMMQNGISAEHPKIQKAIKYVEGFVRDDGGVYSPNSNLRN